MRAIASHLNDTPQPTVTEIGGWGTWVNGGAWLTIGRQRVDWLYRDIDVISSVIDDCYAGRICSDYWQQPAYGFQSFMYCAELVICHPLFDPDQTIKTLKTRVAHYAPELQHTIVQTFLWHARFTLDNTAKPASRGDTYIVAGCLARAIHCLVLVLYALNETYYLSEKTLAIDLRAFHLQPDRFLQRITSLLGAPGTTSAHLLEALAQTETLYHELAALAGVQKA